MCSMFNSNGIVDFMFIMQKCTAYMCSNDVLSAQCNNNDQSSNYTYIIFESNYFLFNLYFNIIVSYLRLHVSLFEDML